ncbi:hypothetical protein GCM10023210_03770 [Chryseobacterium ginsengisoli]|uniref:6-phosphogluconate dehydrogenase n=1 Tax=Chryseobacterium ginsengisoli TaxID=363853 RepID=A0ABP9LWH5_9FLAO
MKRKDLLLILLSIFLAGFILFLIIYSPNNITKSTIERLQFEIKGKVIEKIEVRKNLISHVKLKISNKKDTVIFIGESIDSINIGDYMSKSKNSPFFYVKNNQKFKKLKFVSISKNVIYDENFPKEWKDSCKTIWKGVVVN